MLRFLLLGYLIGSVPVAYLFARWFRGQDIRQVGSKNAGTANVMKIAGWLPGLLTLVGDVTKGYLSVLVGGLSASPLLRFLTPAFAIAGHNWPVWLRFRGGGGLATFVGGCLAVTSWPLALVALALWGLLYLCFRDHDKSAVMACILLPCATWIAQQSAQTVIFVASSSLMILIRRLQSIYERALHLRQQSRYDASQGADA